MNWPSADPASIHPQTTWEAAQRPAFNVRGVFSAGMNRLYRVYVTEDALIFIRIGGQGGMDTAVAVQFGALGMLVLSALRKRQERAMNGRLADLDHQDPVRLLDTHKHNFRVPLAELPVSAIEPAAKLHWHGPHVGRWELALPDRKILLQFEKNEELAKALSLLPPQLGERLRVNVVWDAAKKRYAKAPSRP